MASNDHWNITVRLKKDFDIKGFEYFSIGPVFTYDSFSRNLSHFTFGHGGYFSPQSMFQGVFGLDFMTEEGKNYLVRGSVGAGAQTNTQDASPLFPLSSGADFYASDDSSSGVFYVNVEAAHQLTEHLNFGISTSYAQTPQYNEFLGFLYISLGFGDNHSPGLYMHDLVY